MVMHKERMVETAGTLVHNPPVLLMLGVITLIGGLAMVLCHNIWSGGALPIVVTLFGWSILIGGLLLLFLPRGGQPFRNRSFRRAFLHLRRHLACPRPLSNLWRIHIILAGHQAIDLLHENIPHAR